MQPGLDLPLPVHYTEAMDLLSEFLKALTRHHLLPYMTTGRLLVVAVSGGADSLCLLHLLHRASSELGLRLHVATLDHGLRGEASRADAEFVAQTAAAWGLPVTRERVDVAALAALYSLSIEEAARRARYSFLARVAVATGAAAIALGHTADDQAETLLMHLLRGSGLTGLRGMQPATPLTAAHLLADDSPPSGVTLLRPLLGIPRAATQAYCDTFGLPACQDDTNADLTYFRNRIRHEALPLLERLTPGIQERLAQTAEILAADYTALEAQISAALATCLLSRRADRIVLRLSRFRSDRYPVGIQRGMLRLALRHLAPAGGDISYAALEKALQVARQGVTGQQADLPGGFLLRIEYDRLILQPADVAIALPDWPLLQPGTVLPVTVPGYTALPDCPWALEARWLTPDENPAAFHGQPLVATLAVPPETSLILRTRRPGDRFQPFGLAGQTQKVKDFLINAHVPAGVRDRLPLLIAGDAIAWVVAGPHSRIAQPYALTDRAQAALLLRWERF